MEAIRRSRIRVLHIPWLQIGGYENGADGGVDIILYQQGVETPAIIVQCKSWSQKVGVKAIRELFGVMAADQIGYGVFANHLRLHSGSH